MWSRLLAVLCLTILSPLVAEYLLGSLPVSMLPILPVLMLMYGTGAVLIREIVRHTGRGWPSLILLATAYGFIEEGLVDQSLFNPNYLHLRLLDFGFIPWLGTSPVWAIYVLGLHMFWSIAVPVGLTECLFPAKRATPWLGPVGLGIFGVLYLLGSGLVAAFTYKSLPFMAQPAQLIGVGVIVAVLVATALLLPKADAANSGKVPHPAALFLMSLVPGSLFVASEHFGPTLLHLAWPGAVALLAGCEILMLVLMAAFTRGRAWTDTQRFALMAGGFATYLWLGFPTDATLHGASDLPGHAILAAVMVAVLVAAGVRAATFKETR